jgi:hypothetical protein
LKIETNALTAMRLETAAVVSLEYKYRQQKLLESVMMKPVIQSSPIDLDGFRHHTALYTPESEREAKDKKL